MNHKISLAVCDCDGTILDDSKNIDSGLCEAKRKLEENGIGLTLASGRNIYLMQDILKLLDIKLPYISDNGGNLYQGKKRLINNVLPNRRTDEIAAFLHDWKIPFLVYTDNAVYTSLLSAQLEIFVTRLKNKMTILAYSADHDFNNESSFKITVDSSGLNQFEEMKEVFKIKFSDVSFHQSEGALYTITSLKANKGDALKQLAGILKVPLKEVIVFGDNHNDISMFSEAGFSVAVSNAEQDALDAADDICESNNDNGVSRYLNEYLNQKHN